MGALDGRTAFVSGAARGIGAGIARRLATDGASLWINYAHSRDAAEALAADIRALGGMAETIRGDVAVPADIDRMAADLSRASVAIDILVNNAGRGAPQRDTSLAGMSAEDYDTVFALNTRGLFFLTQRLLPLLREDGRIINLSSTAAGARMSGLSAYAGSKAAVDAFTRVWAIELAPRRITVNAILPGMVDTDLISRGMGDEAKALHARRHPLGRIAQPDDIADLVAFLAGHDGRWVNGQSIVAAGGIALTQRSGRQSAKASLLTVGEAAFDVAGLSRPVGSSRRRCCGCAGKMALHPLLEGRAVRSRCAGRRSGRSRRQAARLRSFATSPARRWGGRGARRAVG